MLFSQPLSRCLAELNRSNWFCRPVPNLPAQAPLRTANIGTKFDFAKPERNINPFWLKFHREKPKLLEKVERFSIKLL